MPLRVAGGPSHSYRQLCSDTTSHHNVTGSSTHYCAYDAAAREPPPLDHHWEPDWESSPDRTQFPIAFVDDLARERDSARSHSPIEFHCDGVRYSPRTMTIREALDVERGGRCDDWEKRPRPTRVPTSEYVQPHPGQKRGESCINKEYIEELAKQESKTVKVLRPEDDPLKEDEKKRARSSLSRTLTPDEQHQVLRRGDRILKAIKGRLEWALSGKKVEEVFDEVFWKKRKGTDDLKRNKSEEKEKWSNEEDIDRYFANRAQEERGDGGLGGERREMRERWKSGLIEEAEKVGTRVVN